MILYRKLGKTVFTSEKPARPGSVAATLPRVGTSTRFVKVKLSPELWKSLGSPEWLTVEPGEGPWQTAAPIVAAGGIVGPDDSTYRLVGHES